MGMQKTTGWAAFCQAYDHPPAEFSPIPMWFWNDTLDEAEIRRQIQAFHQREIYGFMIHPRIGIPRSLPYLSDRFLDMVACAVAEAARLQMAVMLYDEGMYPSGSAHGQVVAANPAYAAQALVRYTDDEILNISDSARLIHTRSVRLPDGQSIRVAYVQEPSGGKIRGIHFGEDSGQPDAPPAADLLNPDATACFIRLTHERYYHRLAPYFGTTIQAMFTDEPSLLGRGPMEHKLPWTTGLLDDWRAAGQTADDLEALFPESKLYDAALRRQFDALCRWRLTRTYYEPIARWCESHRIALTGHPAQSDDFALLRPFHIPGQDLVLRKVGPEDNKSLVGRDSTLAKCCADAARQAGRKRNAVEALGCCVRNDPSHGWDLPPDDMKWYLDWLAVRGVNLFILHAFYYSLRGRRALERPPDVGPAQTWWDEYAIWARYMRRLSSLMTSAGTIRPAAVLCRGDHLPWQIVKPLYEHQLDFHYLEDEELIGSRAALESGRLQVGDDRYTVLLVEDPDQFPDAVQKRLEDCRQAGVRLITASANPDGFRNDPDWIDDLVRDAPVRIYGADNLNRLRLTCRERRGDRFILLVNEGDESLDFELDAPWSDQIPVVWDPWNGTWSAVSRGTAAAWRLRLTYRQSLVLIFPGETGLKPVIKPDRRVASLADLSLDLSDDWQLRPGGEGTDRTVAISDSASWHRLLDDPFYAGAVDYHRSFWLEQPAEGPAWLDLGDVRDAATLMVNDRKIGTIFWPPYRFELTDALWPGLNQVHVRVMNAISCKMDQVPRLSGLLGPVRLHMAKPQKGMTKP